jgi:hypothetical protein
MKIPQIILMAMMAIVLTACGGGVNRGSANYEKP